MVGDHSLCIRVFRLQIPYFQTGQVIAITRLRRLAADGVDAWGIDLLKNFKISGENEEVRKQCRLRSDVSI